MRKIILGTFLGLSLISCNKEKTSDVVSELDLELPENADYSKISGLVENLDIPVDSVLVLNPEFEYKKVIKIDSDGKFSDTLRIPENGLYRFKIGNEYGQVFLSKGVAVGIRTDYQKFDETLKFEGKGVGIDKSNLMIELTLLQEKEITEETFDLEESEFDKRMENLKNGVDKLLSKYNSIDEEFSKKTKAQIDAAAEALKMMYLNKKEIAEKFIGKPSPSFEGEDVNGKKIKLEDFRGKYVLVDIWATWCGPCKAEIPALKELEKEFRGKNIEFVSFSVDDAVDKDIWKKFIKENEMKGVQIFADNSWKSNFLTELKVQGIPRFVLIDPKGNIVDPFAPTPSSGILKEKIKDLEM